MYMVVSGRDRSRWKEGLREVSRLFEAEERERWNVAKVRMLTWRCNWTSCKSGRKWRDGRIRRDLRIATETEMERGKVEQRA